MAALLVGGGPQLLPAQTPPAVVTGRRAVRPQTMATGTQNPAAGVYHLDSLPMVFNIDRERALVYVPEACAGARRCPLVTFLTPGPTTVLKEMRGNADKYGFIFVPIHERSANEATASEDPNTASEDPNKELVDAVLTQVLRRFAIDPTRIALMSEGGSGPAVISLSENNPNMFIRLVSISADPIHTLGLKRRNTTIELLFASSVLEPAYRELWPATEMRREGYHVKQTLSFRPDYTEYEDFDFASRWLLESWATPNPAARRAPQVVAKPVPLLTPDVLAKMTAFWTQFQREPGSIRTTARQLQQREVVVPIDEQHPFSVMMMDVPALAARYPSVAADLKQAGLTAPQHEAYRIALLSVSFVTTMLAEQQKVIGEVRARDSLKAVRSSDVNSDSRSPFARFSRAKEEAAFKRWSQRPAVVVKAGSVLGKNLAFLAAHPDELQALAATRMWYTP